MVPPGCTLLYITHQIISVLDNGTSEALEYVGPLLASENRLSFTSIEDGEYSDFCMNDEDFYNTWCNDLIDVSTVTGKRSRSGDNRNNVKKTKRTRQTTRSKKTVNETPNEESPSSLEYIPSPAKLACTDMRVKEVYMNMIYLYMQ